MKIIDLLNKIANGEISEDTLIEFDNGYKDYCSVRVFFDRYIIDRENLNCEVEIIEENKPKTFNDIRESYGLPRIEDKKIEKIKILNCDNYVKKENYETILTMQEIALDIQTLKHKVNEIIDKLNSMVE